MIKDTYDIRYIRPLRDVMHAKGDVMEHDV